MRILKQPFLLLLVGVLFLSSCSDSDKDPVTPDPTVTTKFVIAGSAAVAEQAKTYLFVADELNQGKISVQGNGFETDGSTLQIQNNKAFAFKYNRGDPGFTDVFKLTSGKLEKVSSFSVKSVNVFLPFKNSKYLLAYNIARTLEGTGTAYYINTETNKVERDAAINQNVVYADGKHIDNYYAFMTSYFEVGERIYGVFYPSYGGTGPKDANDYRDRASVAIFDKDMKFIKTITDKRMPYVGRYYTTTGLAQTESGEIYVFSNGEGTYSNNHSAFLKVKDEAFDANYYWDVEQAAGKKIYFGKYLGNNKFLMIMGNRDLVKAGEEGGKLAILDVVNKKLDWVTGITNKIVNFESFDFPLFTHGGKGYIALSESASLSVIYEIDPATNTGKRGLELTGVSSVSGLGVLKN